MDKTFPSSMGVAKCGYPGKPSIGACSIGLFMQDWGMKDFFADEPENQMDPVVIPIDGVLDLHTFSPGDLDLLLQDYIDVCLNEKIYNLRIIHGKGSGVMRARVRSLLKKDSRVRHFEDAPADAGGWGATQVKLKREMRC